MQGELTPLIRDRGRESLGCPRKSAAWEYRGRMLLSDGKLGAWASLSKPTEWGEGAEGLCSSEGKQDL